MNGRGFPFSMRLWTYGWKPMTPARRHDRRNPVARRGSSFFEISFSNKPPATKNRNRITLYTGPDILMTRMYVSERMKKTMNFRFREKK